MKFRQMLIILIGLAFNFNGHADYADDARAQAADAHGMLLSDAKESALDLEQGMTTSQVRKMLGAPDSTEAKTYGQATDHPWQGVRWIYQFMGPNGNGYFGGIFITFESDNGTLHVNNWRTNYN